MAYQKPMEITEDKISKINSAGLINITLEELWKDSYNALSSGNYPLWNKKLDCIWLILGGDIKEKSEEENEYHRIDAVLYETGSLNHKKTGFEIIKNTEKSNMAIQYLILRRKALFLRRLQNKQGKGTAYQNDTDYDMD